MEVLLPPKHPASATVSQASWEARLHLKHLLLQLLLLLLRLLLSSAVRVRPALVSRPDMDSRQDMASSPPPQPSKLRSKLLLVHTATRLLRRVLELIPSALGTTSPQHPADLRVSLALPAPVSEEAMVLEPATVPLRVPMASRPRPAMASRLATAAQADMVVPEAATAETAAMALPAAVLMVVIEVDMVEAAPLVEDTAAPDMEALGGEELSFCVYG